MDGFQKHATMNRGIRQGCPISAILYLFLRKFYQAKLKIIIQYIDLPKKNFQDEIKNVQYADDMTVTLGEIESMKHAIDTIYKFFNYM